ncbi:MAG: hypothetical protein JWM90_806, partial [Thermoleophilia bacterium]|nr:hypothetical protein [Thermoleophilia bacterium]
PTPADDDAVDATTELDATPEPEAETLVTPIAADEQAGAPADEPTLVTPVTTPSAADTPARHSFDRRTAGITAIGISALLIAFFSGYAVGGADDDDDERGFRGAPVGMRGGSGDAGQPQLREHGGTDGRQQQGGRGGQGMRGELRQNGRPGGAVGAVTKVDGDEVTVKPARGGDTVTVDREDVVAVGGRGGRSDADETAQVEVGDIVVIRTDE